MTDQTATELCQDVIGHGCFARDLDGHVQAFTPSIRDRLIERQALTLKADGCWYLSWHGFDLDREKAADMGCCDFCSARPVAWVVPCQSFAMPGLIDGRSTGMSQGDWAACTPCGEAIDRRDRLTVLRRALDTPMTGYGLDETDPDTRRLIRRVKKAIHQRFWAHYHGGAIRVTPHPYGH